MDLPFVLDVAIGLILIFLILSLLLTEVQEVITTILQWRAQHLRESIELLLAGGVDTQSPIQDLASKLYDDPLIRNINHEAKGLPGKIRKISQWLLPLDFRNIFGGNRTTGPSYMAAETFTASFIEQTGLAVLARKLIEVRLESFAKRVVGLYDLKEDLRVDGSYKRSVTPLPNNNEEIKKFWNKGRVRLIAENANIHDLATNPGFQTLVNEFADIVLDFKNKENNLHTSIARMEETLSTYIESCSPESKENEGTPDQDEAKRASYRTFVKELRSLKKSMFGDKGERALASDTLCPSLLEFAELLDQTSQTYQEVQKAFKDLIYKVEGSQVQQSSQAEKGQAEKNSSNALAQRVLEKVLQKMIADRNHEVLLKQALMDFPERTWKQINRRFQNPPIQGRYSNKRLFNKIRIKIKLKDKIERLNKKKFGKKIEQLNKRIRLCKQKLRHLRQEHSSGKVPRPASSRADKVILSRHHQYQRQKRKLLASILFKLKDETQIEILQEVVNSLSDKEKFTYLGRDTVGFIDRALDRLPMEERHYLFNYAFEQIKKEEREPWSREYELKQRSLYSDYETYKRLHIVLSQLPGSIKESFAILARRAQTRLEKGESDINQFRQEVAVWFDQSMERASGVYKRNAKGVSILLGISIAFMLNVDTLYIVSRLSNDENLRRVVTESAIELGSNENRSGDQRDLERLRNETDEVLKRIVLPIGWNSQNLDAQLKCSSTGLKPPATWQEFYQRCLADRVPVANQKWQNLFQVCLEKSASSASQRGEALFRQCLADQARSSKRRAKEKRNPLMVHIQDNSLRGIRLLRIYSAASFTMILGWFISGFAISMGATFWFDLLNRIINVRQTGSKPASTAPKLPPQ